MATNKKIDYSKKLQNQKIIIIALAIIIFVLIAVSSTAAWYITTRTDTADIVLGKPVMPRITSFEKIVGENDALYEVYSTTENLTGNTRVYPGDQITMSLGFVLGDEKISSSPAYVRVKLSVTYTNIYTNKTGEITDFNSDMTEGEGQVKSLIEYNSSIASGEGWEWKLINFNQGKVDKDGNDLPGDYWYVLQDSTTKASKIVYDQNRFRFIDGKIELNELNITNKYANCKFHINYSVEAIQIANVEDPILQSYVTAENRTNPWWTNTDIYFDQEVE